MEHAGSAPDQRIQARIVSVPASFLAGRGSGASI